jgi:hypothetical protein
MTIEIKSLPINLTELGAYAFYHGGVNVTISEIP